MSTLKELKTNIQKVIQKMKSNLTNKGVDVSTTPETLNALADRINDVSQGQVPSSTVYSVDLGIYGYSEEELAEVKETLNYYLLDIWNTPKGQEILKGKIDNNTYEKWAEETKYRRPILMPPITVESKNNGMYQAIPAFEKMYGTIYYGSLNYILNSEPSFNSRRLSSLFSDNYYYQKIPRGNWLEITKSIQSLYRKCQSLVSLDIEAPNAENMGYICESGYYLRTANIIAPLSIDCTYAFYYCIRLEELFLDIPKTKGMSLVIHECKELKKITFIIGESSDLTLLSNSNINSNYVFIKNLGANKNGVKAAFSIFTSWGMGLEENRQSLIDTLITYSFDRGAAGYPTMTVALSPTTIGLLTDEEITTINNKGYTLAS